MRKITEIYEQYKIMPNLVLHQLRVAAVVKQICESFVTPVEAEPVVIAGLLHDMGNIIKADLDQNLFTLSNEEIIFWKEEQKLCIGKYGNDTSNATATVAKEIGVTESVQKLIEHNDFKFICDIAQSSSVGKKILKYADLRVGPYGVISLDERFVDIKKRYGELLQDDRRDCAEEIENQIFAHSKLKPEDITDESVRNIIEELKNYEL